jgi:hypothetical protein
LAAAVRARPVGGLAAGAASPSPVAPEPVPRRADAASLAAVALARPRVVAGSADAFRVPAGFAVPAPPAVRARPAADPPSPAVAAPPVRVAAVPRLAGVRFGLERVAALLAAARPALPAAERAVRPERTCVSAGVSGVGPASPAPGLAPPRRRPASPTPVSTAFRPCSRAVFSSFFGVRGMRESCPSGRVLTRRTGCCAQPPAADPEPLSWGSSCGRASPRRTRRPREHGAELLVQRVWAAARHTPRVIHGPV